MLAFADNFAPYGTGTAGRTRMTQGVWTQVPTITANSVPSTANPRVNGTHHFRLAGSSAGAQVLRAPAWTNETTVGMGCAVYVNQLNQTSDGSEQFAVLQARDENNSSQCSITIDESGFVQARVGGTAGSVVATSVNPVIFAGQYHHIEARFVIDNTVGAIEVRVDERIVIDVSGIDTQATSAVGANFACVSLLSSVNWESAWRMDIADFFAWDSTGTINNDFIGDHQYLTNYADADGIVTDWVRNTGSNDFGAIDDVTPDEDTTYIEASSASDVSEFTMTDLPASVNEVIGVHMLVRARKTLAGTTALQSELLPDVSPETPATGADHALTEGYAYYADLFDANPATSVRFTPAEFNSLRRRHTRTA
jgi:hypothetical protein